MDRGNCSQTRRQQFLNLGISLQIQLIDYDEDNNSVMRTVFGHPDGEIWNVTCCPFDAELFATCFNEGTSDTVNAAFSNLVSLVFIVEGTKLTSKGAVWRFPSGSPSPTKRAASEDPQNPVTIPRLEKVVDLKDDETGSDTVG